MSNEIVKQGDVFSNIDNFENAQRMAKMLSTSKLVPQNYQGQIADCVIALEMAQRIGASPLAVMQNLYIVHGKPAWSSQFLISCVNASGKFSPIRYQMSGDGETRACVAWAEDKVTKDRLESPEINIAMAKAEGWFQKNGSKWKTMPDLMLRYRAATLFARLYSPELTMGIHCDDEIIDITPIVTDNVKSPLEQMPDKKEEVPADLIPSEAKPIWPADCPVTEAEFNDFCAKNPTNSAVKHSNKNAIINAILDAKEAK